MNLGLEKGWEALALLGECNNVYPKIKNREGGNMRKLLIITMSLICFGFSIATDQVGETHATMETTPVPHRGDAADDPAIWIHPDDPSIGAAQNIHYLIVEIESITDIYIVVFSEAMKINFISIQIIRSDPPPFVRPENYTERWIVRVNPDCRIVGSIPPMWDRGCFHGSMSFPDLICSD